MSARKRAIAGWLLVSTVAIAVANPTNAQVREPQRPEVRGVVKSVDAAAGTIAVSIGEGPGPTTDQTFHLSKNVEIAVVANLGRGGFSGGLPKEGKVADLAAGVRVTLTLSADQKTVESALAEEPTVRGQLKAVDATKNTITIGLPGQREREREPAVEAKTYSLAPLATVKLSVDQASVMFIRAEGPTLTGLLKAVDPDKGTVVITIPRGRRDDPPDEKTLSLAKDARIVIGGNEAKLTDLAVGSSILHLRLSLDQKTVQLIMPGENRVR